MFKKLVLVLVLVLAVALGTGIAAEENTECTMESGSDIILMTPQGGMAVNTNRPLQIFTGPEIPADSVASLNEYTESLGSDIDWSGAHYAMVEDGNQAIVQNKNIKDCK